MWPEPKASLVVKEASSDKDNDNRVITIMISSYQTFYVQNHLSE
jgi:hypothetical protein